MGNANNLQLEKKESSSPSKNVNFRQNNNLPEKKGLCAEQLAGLDKMNMKLTQAGTQPSKDVFDPYTLLIKNSLAYKKGGKFNDSMDNGGSLLS